MAYHLSAPVGSSPFGSDPIASYPLTVSANRFTVYMDVGNCDNGYTLIVDHD